MNRLQRDRESAQRFVYSRTIGVLLVMIVVLALLGRTPWCSCGGLSPWSWQVQSRHNSRHLIDPYTFTHVLHGLLFFAALRPLASRLSRSQRFLTATIVEAAREILENTPMIIDRYRATTISLDYYGDSIANSVADVIACLCGYAIASRLRWYYSVALFVIVEIGLLITIRDSLLLNIIMLAYPNDTILQWQAK